MPGLWRNSDKAPEGKYLVQRRDGTVPAWPYFVIAAADPAAPKALRAYAKECERIALDGDYIHDLRVLASEFEQWRMAHGSGDPDAPPHRTDDPAIIEKMCHGHGA